MYCSPHGQSRLRADSKPIASVPLFGQIKICYLYCTHWEEWVALFLRVAVPFADANFPQGIKLIKYWAKSAKTHIRKTYTHSCTRARSSRFFAQSIDVCQNRGVTRDFNYELRILKYRDFCSHRNLAVAKSPRVLWPS